MSRSDSGPDAFDWRTCAPIWCVLPALFGVAAAGGAPGAEREFNIAYHLASHDGNAPPKKYACLAPDEVEKDFKKISDLGFTHVTIWPGSVISQELGNLDITLKAVEIARKYGLKAYIWIWTGGNPRMYGSPGFAAPAMVNKNGKEVEYSNVMDEKWRNGFMKEWLTGLATRFKGCDNVVGYVVDEPFGKWWNWVDLGYDDGCLRQFRAATEAKYKAVSALNSSWGEGLKDWTEISPPKDKRNAKKWQDWIACKQAWTDGWVTDANRFLKEAHPGSKIMWSITYEYVSWKPQDLLDQGLDYARMAPKFDVILMCKFSGKNATLVKDNVETCTTLLVRPELAKVRKALAQIWWKSSWVEKVTPEAAVAGLEVGAKYGFDTYVWAWKGKDHLESWPDVQDAVKKYIAREKGK